MKQLNTSPILPEFHVPTVHSIDAMWCDAHGVFVKGWVHAHTYRVISVSLRSGTCTATSKSFEARPDLRESFPRLPSTNCGFAIYLACPPFRPVFLEFETSVGIVRKELSALPEDHWLNALPPVPPDPMPIFVDEMKQKRGRVLEVGARAVSPGQVLQADQFRPECEFIGVDIHPAPGVDIVADAHFLSDTIPRSSIDGLFSSAVMEHLASPWLFAGEINKVLKIGGLTMHAVPHSFPIHEVPNDFWRVSEDGLRVLFSNETGFEVIASGMTNPVKMFVHPQHREGHTLETALFDGMLTSFILARKIADLPNDAIKWPVPKSVSFARARAYPAHQAPDPDPVPPVAERGPLIQFDEQGLSIEADCPACSKPGIKNKILTVNGYTLYKCRDCGSDFYHPFPRIDYRAHTPPLGVRDYVELNASIEFPARNILRLVPPGKHGKLLDVGCGFGFALDLTRALLDWEVKGFEPSQYGGLGRSQLGVDIVQDFARPNSDPTLVYDIVYCSEVIEHVAEPREFLSTLVSYLGDEGVLVITTPNPDVIRKGSSEHSLIALLSPGAHTILFSERVMRDLFASVGLNFTKVEKSADSTLYYASRRRFELCRDEIDAGELLRYFELALFRPSLDDSVAIGLRYRLFRTAVDQGRFDVAARAYRAELGVLDPEVEEVSSLETFAARWPLCIAASTYYCGMFNLLGIKDFALAASYFRAAFELCRKKLDIAPTTSAVEADLVWRAKYHEALAYEWSGLHSKAEFAISRLFVPGVSPKIPESLSADIERLRGRLSRAWSERTSVAKA